MRGGGRSHRLPEPEEWVDGSWTVDCVCGVNYDDGEEMVSCDECGIWVHTRCSRFVKGETSFACDKCKSKKTRKENEETEVAQLLVELPTKTLKMDSFSSRRPFRRLWTDIPIEERVHVQGVPGGEPSVFQGLSSVFTPQLWKCTGYVPKKFYFQYREFPCWDERPGGDSVPAIESQLPAEEPNAEEENENAVDRGADVLFSLSKEIPPYTPSVVGRIDTSVDGVRHDCEWGVSHKDIKERESKIFGNKHLKDSGKRERSQPHQHVLHSGKKRKEESRGSKDNSGKKKAKSVDREDEAKKRGSSVEKVQSKRFTPITDMRKLDFHEDGVFEVGNTDYEDLNNEAMPPESDFDGDRGCCEAQDNGNKPKHIIVVRTLSAGISNEWDRHRATLETQVRMEKVVQVPVKDENSPRIESCSEAVAETDDVPRVSIKEEDTEMIIDGLNLLKEENHYVGDLAGGSSSVTVDSQRSKPHMGELKGTVPVLPDTSMPQDPVCDPVRDILTISKVKKEVQDDQVTAESASPSSSVSHRKLDVDNHLPHHSNTLGISDGHISETFRGHETAINGLQSGEHMSQDAEAVSFCDGNNIAEEMLSRSDEVQPSGRESEEAAGLLTMRESSSQSKHNGKLATRPSKSGGMDPSLPAPKVRKLVVGASTSKSSSGSIKLSISSSHKPLGSPASPTTAKPHFSKHRVKSNPSTDGKKGEATMDMRKEENLLETQRASTKEHKGSVNSGPKISHTSRVMHASVSKHASSDSKEPVFSPPSKASVSSHNVVISSGSVDSQSLSQSQIASSTQNKHTVLGSCQKSEKNIQSSSLPSSKVSNHSPLMHPPAPVSASAALSDEELALLLHQELNSSPRVPRVPRVRQAGSLPQLASSTTSSMFVKRSSVSASPSSSVGLKDQILVLKRKNKEDTGRDSSRNSREVMDETQKADISPSSPNLRRQDPIFKTDDSTRRNFEYRSTDAFGSGKKNNSLTTTTAESSFHSSYVKANDQNQSLICNSPGDVADDANAIVSVNTQTLPGLINEIMSKGRRMSIEELCDAVLPHWQNLRKHNGERYAYSSHSQAVLDCLRNRDEWSHLVDRGPKTNLNRKRRKVDTDQPVIESDSEDLEGRGAANTGEGRSAESHQEDVPKGKRKARKGRQLTLHGRVTEEIRKRKKDAPHTDDEDDDDDDDDEDDDGDTVAFSHSSDGSESFSSEDDSQGATTGGGAGSETSSSDETG